MKISHVQGQIQKSLLNNDVEDDIRKQLNKYKHTTVKWIKIKNYGGKVQQMFKDIKNINCKLPMTKVCSIIFNILHIYIKTKL